MRKVILSGISQDYVELLQKVIKNPEKIPYHIFAKFLMRNSITHEQDILGANQTLWKDNPSDFLLDFHGVPNQLTSAVVSALSDTEQLLEKKEESSMRTYHPSLRFLSVKKNVSIYWCYFDGVFRVILFNRNGQVIGPLTWPNRKDNKRTLTHSLRSITQERGTKSIINEYFGQPSVNKPHIDTGILLSSACSDQYGHWHLEQMTKIHRAKIYEKKTGDRPTILLRKDTADWQFEMLRYFGYTEYDWKVMDDCPIHIKKLLITDHKNVNSTNFNIALEDYNWISQYTKKIISKQNKRFSRRIFLSREQSRRRHIVNYQEVKRLLSNYGFKSYSLLDLSFEEQIQLFDDADIVVSPAGADLTNMIYSTNIDIVCLYPSGPWIPALYFAMAQGLDHNLVPYFSQPVASDMSKQVHYRNIRVNIDEIEEIIMDII